VNTVHTPSSPVIEGERERESDKERKRGERLRDKEIKR
jgi:hypothetical protein